MMRHRECTADRRGNRYIESEERWTRMHQVREVHDRALPDRSHETNEMLGVDLMQEGEKVEWRRVGNECGCRELN